MGDDVETELIKKRSELNSEAERHRRERDKLNDEARRWIDRRDAFNAKAKEFAEKASECKRKRDELNAEVRKNKEDRDVWNRNYHHAQDELDHIKRTKTPAGAAPTGRLRRDLEALEYKHQTSVLSPSEEKALMERMSRITREIKKVDKQLEQDPEIKTAMENAKKAYDEAEKFHKQVEDSANRAQEEHDKMVKLYEQSDAVRREADTAQERFIAAKLAADEEHKKHVEMIKQVHDCDKMLTGMKQKGREPGEESGEDVMKKQAEDIYNKFKSGEKLSTDDLMALQKAGYL